MTMIYADRVLETTTTTGLSNYTLAGAQDGHVTFEDGIGTSKECRYYCTNGVDWEIGVGELQGDGVTLTRSVEKSSNSDAKVSWSAGAKDIGLDVPADVFNVYQTRPKPVITTPSTVNLGSDAAAAIGQAHTIESAAVDAVAVGNGAHAWLPGQLAISGGMLDAVPGSAQPVIMPLSCQTTDDTPTYLMPYGISGDYNELTLSVMRDDTAAFYQAHVIGVDVATGDIKTWVCEWAETKIGAAAQTIVGTPTVTAKFASAGAAAWTLTVESTVQGARLQVTGETAHDINWVATQIATNVGY